MWLLRLLQRFFSLFHKSPEKEVEPMGFGLQIGLELDGGTGIGVEVSITVTTPPLITGTPEIDQTLTGSDGAATGEGATTVASRQWYRDGSPISTSPTYTLLAADDGASITFGVVWQDDNGPIATTFSSGVAITYAAPMAAGALVDQSFSENTGIRTYDVSGDFTGQNLSYAVQSGPGSINSSGIYSIDTDTASQQTGTSIVIRATNSGGFVDSGFSLTIQEPLTLGIENTGFEIEFSSNGSDLTVTIGGVNYTHDVRDGTTPINETNLNAGPIPITRPTESGTEQVGQTLTGTLPLILYNGPDLGDTAVEWINQIDGPTGDTDPSYLIASGDEADTLIFRATYGSMVVDSLPTGPIASADITAPILSLPTGVSNGETGAQNLTVTTDEGNGTASLSIFLASATPSDDDIENGTGAAAHAKVAVTSAGLITFADQTGLTPGTAYVARYIHRDTAGNLSAASASAEFTTDSGVVPIVPVFLDVNHAPFVFFNVDMSSHDPAQKVLVIWGLVGITTPATMDSITLDGVAASTIGQASITDGNPVGYAIFPAGSYAASSEIAYTSSNGGLNYSALVFDIPDTSSVSVLNSSPATVQASTDLSGTVTAGSAVVAATLESNGTGATWTGLANTGIIDIRSNEWLSYAHEGNLAAGGRTITANHANVSTTGLSVLIS